MAEEEEDEKKAPGSDAGDKPKRPLILIVIIVVQALALVGGTGAYFTVLKPKTGPETTTLDSEAAMTEEETIEAKFEEEMELMEGEKPLGAIYPLDTFVVNLRDKGFLKVRIQMEFIGRDIPTRFLARQVLVRDSLITLLSSKTGEDIVTSAGKDKLKDEVKEIVNSIIRKESIERVFFTEFVVR
jgi:flagellar protein FliL